MALSMDEQRMLAEIERRLAAEDPGLAARLSAFRRPGPAARLRSPRSRIIGSLFTVALVAIVSMMVYAMIPFRAHSPKTTSPQASGRPALTAPARITQGGGVVKATAPANPAATSATTSKTASAKADSHSAATATSHSTTTSKSSATKAAGKTTAAAKQTAPAS